MSLINQMLKDLERRRTQNKQPEDDINITGLSAPDSGIPGHSSNFRRIAIYVAIIISILVILVLLAFFVRPYILNNHETQIVQPVKTTVPASPTKETKVVKPMPETTSVPLVVLQQISTHTENNTTTLQLDLSQKVHYRFDISDDHQHLSLILDNTQFTKSLPVIEENSVILDMQSKTTPDGDFELQATVRPETEVAGLRQTEQKPFQLILTLFNKDIPVEEVKSTTQPTAKDEEEEGEEDAEVKKVVIPLTQQQITNRDYQQCLDLIAQDHVNQAIDQLEALLSKTPDFLAARKTLVVLLIKQNRLGTAKVHIQEGLRITPDSSDLIKLYAQILANEGNFKMALFVLQQTSPAIEDDPDYYALMATLQQRLGKPQIAAQLYKQLLQLRSGNATWWLGLGIALETTGKFNEALQAYQRAAVSGSLKPSLQAFVETKIQQLGGGG